MKISRHLEDRHFKEPEVAKAMALRVGSKERKLTLEKLRLLGNFHHNQKVLSLKEGELKVIRRPSPCDSELDATDFLPCVHCYGFIRKKELWKHVKTCQFKLGKKVVSNRHLRIESAMLLADPVSPDDTKGQLISHVLSIMQQDSITEAVEGDEVILTFGATLMEKGGSNESSYISQRMREIARLLLELRKHDQSDASLCEFIKPGKFDLVIKAVKNVSGYFLPKDGNSAGFRTPSLALKLGNTLRKCAAIIRGFALRRNQSEMKEDVNSYLQLHDSEWSIKISSVALSTLSERKFNNPEILPLTDDLLGLRKFQLQEIERLTAEVGTEPTRPKWSELAEVTVTRLILFNKRRGGEAARLKLESYKNRPSWGSVGIQEVVKSLKSSEQELSKRLVVYMYA